jgi:hypothetical protein
MRRDVRARHGRTTEQGRAARCRSAHFRGLVRALSGALHRVIESEVGTSSPKRVPTTSGATPPVHGSHDRSA